MLTLAVVRMDSFRFCPVRALSLWKVSTSWLGPAGTIGGLPMFWEGIEPPPLHPATAAHKATGSRELRIVFTTLQIEKSKDVIVASGSLNLHGIIVHVNPELLWTIDA